MRLVKSLKFNLFDLDQPLVSLVALEGAEEKAKQLRKVIARKNMVQYESRSARQSDADEMVKVTTRFYQWVLENLR